ncbi:cytochrome b-c1 complex subunit 7 [Nemania sp. NC0429]|nr:cytochrome b-c1 complex subunit 7 [Nemania sp. NC0429]
MPYPSLAPFVLKRPWLYKALKPVANWYTNAAGYRQLGLRADDLLLEENEDVLKALQRLPPRELYDRVYRIRRAIQCSVSHKLLPRDQWTKPEEDVMYLTPILRQIKAAAAEKDALDTLTVVKKGH